MKIFIGKIFLVFILCFLFYFIIVKPNNKFYTNKKILSDIRNLLKNIDDIFYRNDITYWMDGGTLLGAIRHANIIPWDDDGDLVVLSSDETKLLNLRDDFKKYGYGLSKSWCGYKIYLLEGTDIKYQNRNWYWSEDCSDISESETFNYKFPFIDILLVDEENDILNYTNKRAKKVWPGFYHDKKDTFPLSRYKFDTFYLNGPSNPRPFLDRAYGADWPKIGYRQYDHENQIKIPKKTFNIL